MVNFGLLTAEIRWRVWGTPANFNGFRVLAALLHGNLVVCLSQTSALNRGRQLYSAGRPSRWALAHILVNVARLVFSTHCVIIHAKIGPAPPPINHTRPSPRKHSPDVTTPSEMAEPESDYCLLLIYRPRKDERLSWPSWLTMYCTRKALAICSHSSLFCPKGEPPGPQFANLGRDVLQGPLYQSAKFRPVMKTSV